MNIVRPSVISRCLGAAALLALASSCNGTPANAAEEESAPESS